MSSTEEIRGTEEHFEFAVSGLWAHKQERRREGQKSRRPRRQSRKLTGLVLRGGQLAWALAARCRGNRTTAKWIGEAVSKLDVVNNRWFDVVLT